MKRSITNLFTSRIRSLGNSTLCFALIFASSGYASAQSNNALDFDGSSDYVNIGTPSPSLPQGNSPWTVEAWVKTSQGSIGNIVSWGSRFNNNRVGVAVRNGGGAFIGENNDLTPGVGAKINDGVWHHLVVVCRGTTSNNIQIYVDGTLKSQGRGALNVSGQNLRLGRISSPSNGEYYDGIMDEVRIWNYARTSTEINNQKNKELQGDESGLIAYYSFNQGVAGGNNSTVTTLLDNANSNNGSLITFLLNGNASNWVGGAPIQPANPISCAIVDPSVSCFGANTGSATVQVSNGASGSSYTYSWSGGATTSSSTAQTVSGLASGSYTVTVTQGSTSTTCAVTITEGVPMQLWVRQSDSGSKSSRPSGNDGFLSTVDGGKDPLSYSWIGDQSSSTDANPSLQPGRYMLRVSDDNGCEEVGGPYFLK